MKFLIGGGSGFIGTCLCSHLRAKGHEILVISRSAGQGKLTWEELKKTKKLPECDGIVNLAGENILNPFRRWGAAYKADVRSSRIGTNRILMECLKNTPKPPSVFVGTSAIGYYPSSNTVTYDEDFVLKPTNFVEQLTFDWEESTTLPENLKSGVRHAIVRAGVVLGKEGGIIAGSIWPFWLGLGGRVGSGKQPFPWIHINDIVGIYTHVLENECVSGILNGVAPEPCDNETFTKEFASALSRPAIFPVPTFVLNLLFTPERAMIVAQGQRVHPKRTLESGYNFAFPNLKTALSNILKS